jgi:hypothetical protein
MCDVMCDIVMVVISRQTTGTLQKYLIIGSQKKEIIQAPFPEAAKKYRYN